MRSDSYLLNSIIKKKLALISFSIKSIKTVFTHFHFPEESDF